MSTTHQGAVGAETMTAGSAPAVHKFHINAPGGPNIFVEGNDWFVHAHEHAEYREWAEARIAALSTPAPRTDGGMTAGEVEAIASAAYDAGFDASGEGWNGEYPENCNETASYRQRKREYLNGIATPAQPAGAVPDGLRAAIEALDAARAEEQRRLANGEGCRLYRIHMPMMHAQEQALEFARTLLASHPAGQSAGSGVDLFEAGRRLIVEWGDAPELPEEMENALTRFEKVWLALDDGKPAPDSTRTGDEGAEEAAGLMSQVSTDHIAAFDDIARDMTNLYAPDGPPALRQGILAALLQVHLAARPAAPEAQGAWQDISTAPPNKAVQVYVPNHDYYGNEGVYAGMLVDMGTGQRWMTFAWAMGRDMCGDDRPTHWRPLPAPPASSGQGGR